MQTAPHLEDRLAKPVEHRRSLRVIVLRGGREKQTVRARQSTNGLVLPVEVLAEIELVALAFEPDLLPTMWPDV